MLCPFFVDELLAFQVIEVKRVRVGVLLLVKFNLLCLEMLTKAGCDFFFWFSTDSELNFFVKLEISFLKSYVLH